MTALEQPLSHVDKIRTRSGFYSLLPLLATVKLTYKKKTKQNPNQIPPPFFLIKTKIGA